MGQKVNPHGLRVGVIKDWDSRWFAKDKDFGDTLVEDYNLRKHLKKKLYGAGVPKIEIERDASKVRIHIHCAKPGMVIGKGGAEIEKLRLECEKILNKPVAINIVEVKSPDLNAQLVAENIAQQLEKRISFRRAMKQAIGRAMRFGAKGIKTQVGGRLGGAEIARTEQYHEGTIPLHTIDRHRMCAELFINVIADTCIKFLCLFFCDLRCKAVRIQILLRCPVLIGNVKYIPRYTLARNQYCVISCFIFQVHRILRLFLSVLYPDHDCRRTWEKALNCNSRLCHMCSKQILRMILFRVNDRFHTCPVH